MKKRIIAGLSAIVTLVSGTAAMAHDFFLLPDEFQTERPAPLRIQATVGSSFPTPEVVVPADRLDLVKAIGPGNPQIKVAATGARSLDLSVTGAKPGVVAVGVGAKARDVEYAEDRIPLILEEYRVAPQSASAVEALPRPRTWLVTSRRFAKTLVCIQTCSDRASVEQPLGAHLEFVGQRSSATHYRLLAEGKPLSNYPVDLVGSDGERQHLTTDERGDVHLPADRHGTTMLFAAKLEPPAGQGRFTLDLTSLTFSGISSR